MSKKTDAIMSGLVKDATTDEIYSVFIKNNKQRAKRTIQHYVRNLPKTYTTSKEVICVPKKIRDIRDSEVRKSINVDPSVISGEQIPIISSDQEFEEKKEYFYVPKFFEVKHSQRLQRCYDEAYKDVLNNVKSKNTMSIHQAAYQAGLNSLNVYADWVFKNNKMLVAKYPQYWSENRPDENKEIVEAKPESFIDKMKKWISNDNK